MAKGSTRGRQLGLAVAAFASMGCLGGLPGTAMAQDQERDYCTDRPGIDTPACTMSPGAFSLEIGLGDWTLNRDSTQRQDTILIGDMLLRYGIAEHAEVQVGWTSLGFARTRDGVNGNINHRSGTGDVMVALRRNLKNPDGSGLSVAVMPFVTLPVGREPFGAGDWGAGVRVPLSYEISDTIGFVSTAEFDAAVDEDGDGRHFAFSQSVGAEVKLSDKVTASLEYQVLFDRAPQDHHVEHLAGLSVALQPADDWQMDLGVNAGLDSDTPDVQVYLGVSRRF